MSKYIEAEKLRAEIERLKSKKPSEYNYQNAEGYIWGLDDVLSFLDTLEAETSYDTQKYTPNPSVDIGDVARVQFASHAKVFDKKRKAVFDWEQFKEVASIFYGFGKKDSQEIKEKEQPTMGYDEAYLNEKIAKASKSWEGVDVDKFMDEVRGLEPVNDCHDLKKHTKEWVELMVGASFPEQEGDFISEEDYRSVIKKTALHFAEWQKAKMMEGAVEGKVFMSFAPGHNQMVMADVDLPTNTKVKIIIVKEDKK